jgi:hypothetical protein
VVRKVYARVLQRKALSNEPITIAEIIRMIAAQKQAEQAVDNFRATVVLLRLQNYIEEEERKKAEEQRRMNETRNALVFLSLFS